MQNVPVKNYPLRLHMNEQCRTLKKFKTNTRGFVYLRPFFAVASPQTQWSNVGWPVGEGRGERAVSPLEKSDEQKRLSVTARVIHTFPSYIRTFIRLRYI